MPLESTPTGLLARAPEYEPLRAFSQGGRYWDRVPQQLIREGALAEFLPPVEVEEDDRGKCGRFHRASGRKELLARSKPLGKRGVPTVQLLRLKAAVETLQTEARGEHIQPQNRELLGRFRLPDIAHDPELYRLAGPWWNRRLQLLWGCERTRDSSLPADAALAKLRPDKFYHLRRALIALLLFLLLLLPAWGLYTCWPALVHWLRQPSAQTQTQPSPKQPAETSSRTNNAPRTNTAEAKRKDNTPTQAAKAAADADAKAKRAQAAAEKADAKAKREQAAAEKAKADALAAQKTADQEAKAAQAAKAAAEADALARCQIVLCDQGQPEADGAMTVSLEVRTAQTPPRTVPVSSWQLDGQTVAAPDRLQTRLMGGDHAVKAVILDAQGQPKEIAAVVTVEPGKVVMTPGKVSVRPK